MPIPPAARPLPASRRIALAAAARCVLGGCAPRHAGVAPPAPAVDHDVAIYDLLLGSRRALLVDSTFATAVREQLAGMVREGVLSAETADDFARANQSRRALPRALRTGGRHFISPAQLPRGPLEEELRARYGVDGATSLSAVGYDARRTEALVAEGWIRGPLNGAGIAIVLRRDAAGTWRETNRRMLWIS